MIPTSLITRVTLDGVAQTYETSVLPTDPDTCVLWDCMQVSGCEVLVPTVGGVKQGSALHRWIVLDAIESAESVPQGTEGKAAIEAARVWVADPSEENRVAAAYSAAAATYAAARLRFRVLATMAQAGVLPNPIEKKP